MQYTTREKLFEEARANTRELMEIDERLASEIRRKETEIKNSHMSPDSKQYGLDLLAKLSAKQQTMTRLHRAKDSLVDAAAKLMEYESEMARINQKYASSTQTLESYVNSSRLSEIERQDIECVKALASSLNSVVQELPSFDELAIELEVM